MYRIRVLNQDGTLGGFFSEKGITKDVTLAKKYESSLSIQADLVRAFNISGRYYQPQLSYGLDTQQAADEDASRVSQSILGISVVTPVEIVSQLLPRVPVLPPYEDLPSRTNEAFVAPYFVINDIDGGYLMDTQQIDLDGGDAYAAGSNEGAS